MSDLDIIIDDQLHENTLPYSIIQEYIKNVPISTIIEIGASSGGGITEALINACQIYKRETKIASIEISRARFKILNETYFGVSFFKAYNISSLPLSRFPSEEEVTKFINETGVHGGNVNEVLRWLRQDVKYVKDNNFDDNGIQKVKDEFGVDKFDLAIIDGSEFLGNEEFKELSDCDAYFLDDIYAYKNWYSHRKLENDKRYVKLFDDPIRIGSSLFCKKEVVEKFSLTPFRF